jgi:hypothetical protein
MPHVYDGHSLGLIYIVAMLAPLQGRTRFFFVVMICQLEHMKTDTNIVVLVYRLLVLKIGTTNSLIMDLFALFC